MSEKDNIRVAKEYIEAMNAHDYTRMSRQHGEGFQMYGPGMPGPLDESAYRAWVEGNWAAFPDQTTEIDQIVAQGDYVVVNWTLTGTHKGPLTTPTGDTVPPTGRKVALPGSTTVEFKDGKSVRPHHYWDNMTFFAQIGVTPGGRP